MVVSRLNKVLEVDYDNRFIRVQSGRTKPECDGCGRAGGFLLRTRPLLAAGLCHRGKYRDEFRRRALPEYGVTTNNLLGVTMVTMEGEVLEIGGAHLDAGGYDLLGVICGSEGQLGVVTEATLRILRKPEGARRC